MVTAGQNYFFRSFLLLIIFYATCFCIFISLEKLNADFSVLTEPNFLNWDAMHYNTIQREGYHTGMVAFFPLFPLLWHVTMLGGMGISLVNGLIYIASLAWLSGLFQISRKQLFLLASVPVLIFMFLPFSESLFFLASVIALAGLKKENYPLLLTGILVAGFTRPVATVFIPALFMIKIFSTDHSRKSWVIFLGLAAACVGTMLLVFVIQYIHTGEWFSFFRVQHDWGNYLRLPVFPLSSWAGGFIVRLDALAFVCGLAAGIYLLFFILQKSGSGLTAPSRNPILFSAAYLSVITIVVLFTRGGVLNSLNRYLICTAFFMMMMHHALQLKLFNFRNVLVLFLATTICWLAFASYVHIQAFLKFALLSGYLILFMMCTSKNKYLKNFGYFSTLLCNMIFMFIFYHRFLNGEWVG